MLIYGNRTDKDVSYQYENIPHSIVLYLTAIPQKCYNRELISLTLPNSNAYLPLISHLYIMFTHLFLVLFILDPISFFHAVWDRLLIVCYYLLQME